MIQAYREFAGVCARMRGLGYALVARFPQDPQARLFYADVLRAGGQDDLAGEQYRTVLQSVLPNQRRRVEQAVRQCDGDRNYFPSAFAAHLASDEYGVGVNAQTWRAYAARDIQRGREIVRQLRQRLSLRGKRVLDVGCGYGGTLIAFAEQGAEVVGVEVDAVRSRVGKQRTDDLGIEAEWHHGDICDHSLCSRLGTLDAIVCQDVLEHVLELRRAVAAICGLLRKGGCLFVQVPNKYSPEFILADHHYGLFGISLLARPQAIEYWRLAYGHPAECYTVGYLRSERYYRRAFARHGVTLEPTEQFQGLGHFLQFAPQMSDLARRVGAEVYPGLRAELEKRIKRRALKVTKLYMHASHILKTLESDPAQLAQGCDLVVRRLCRSVWTFVGTKTR